MSGVFGKRSVFHRITEVLNLELEVLAPAGDRERLLSALNYGADAVYLGRKTVRYESFIRQF